MSILQDFHPLCKPADSVNHYVTSMVETREEHDSVSHELPSFLPHPVNLHRRVSVSAESLQPFTHRHRPVIPKTDQQYHLIRHAITDNFLFKLLDHDQAKDVVNAMVEKRVPRGTVVIEKEAEGDYFYIVESGALDCFMAQDNGSPLVKTKSYGPSESFGELALMYNAPRTATITATTDAVLWALDRVTFRSILMETAARKRRMYEQFLAKVPIFQSLTLCERYKIADALEMNNFEANDIIIREGDVGHNFYIIVDGHAHMYKKTSDGSQVLVSKASKGDYFGELALINDAPRAATVVCL